MLIDRRTMLFATAALAVHPAAAAGSMYVSQRPKPADRKYHSPAVEREISRVGRMIADPKLAWMFENCYPNTLDTTVLSVTADDAFVITGDIPCLWLRDSSAQLRPFLHLAKRDKPLTALFRGLIARQARCVLIDPYANAFLQDPAARSDLPSSAHDQTTMKPGVAERKWEVDSLCYVLRLASSYWRATGDRTPFTAEWAQSARAIIRTFREQQRTTDAGPYRFQRRDIQPTETQLWGVGNPTRKVGLIHSSFRPSDDATILPFLIPANIFAAKTLRELAEVAQGARGDADLAREAATLAGEIEAALAAHGRMRLADGSEVWAFEVDGFGNALFLDDCCELSLSGLSFLGCAPADDPIWRRTEAAAWSDRNPWFVRGKAGEGLGGPHAGFDLIWPMATIVRAFSSNDDTQIRACLKVIRDTDAGTGFIHETFHKDDPSKFTRPWFAWANGLFGELMVHLASTKPHLLRAVI
ncbi:glycoside hydrolase family 125 protein [Sphingomonas sp. PvP056]|uniref:glycoside hydrolase family 125 protein n=1 Tax=Sphingomonas sp. PvP056 TaxID=3156392 RepID=UPI00339AC01A